MTGLAAVRARYDVVAREAAKFGLVGAVNTVLDFGVLNALHYGAGVGTLSSKVVSTVVAATSSYAMNRWWTFRHRAKQDVRREYLLFFGLNVVGLAIALAVLGVVRYGLGQDSALWINAANLVGLVIGTAFRFWSYRRWVWTAAESVYDAAEEGDVAAAAALGTAADPALDPARR